MQAHPLEHLSFAYGINKIYTIRSPLFSVSLSLSCARSLCLSPSLSLSLSLYIYMHVWSAFFFLAYFRFVPICLIRGNSHMTHMLTGIPIPNHRIATKPESAWQKRWRHQIEGARAHVSIHVSINGGGSWLPNAREDLDGRRSTPSVPSIQKNTGGVAFVFLTVSLGTPATEYPENAVENIVSALGKRM